MNGHTPDLHVTAAMQVQRWIVGIRCVQPQSPLAANQLLERERTIQNSHHHPTGPWFEAAINHKEITIVNTCTDHRITTDAQKERADGMTDQLLVQIDPHLCIVICGRGEAGSHPFAGQRKRQPDSSGLQRERRGMKHDDLAHTNSSTNEL